MLQKTTLKSIYGRKSALRVPLSMHAEGDISMTPPTTTLVRPPIHHMHTKPAVDVLGTHDLCIRLMHTMMEYREVIMAPPLHRNGICAPMRGDAAFHRVI